MDDGRHGDDCPNCRRGLGVDALDFYRAHPVDIRDPATWDNVVVCPRCRTRLEPVYDEHGPGDGHWFFERIL